VSGSSSCIFLFYFPHALTPSWSEGLLIILTLFLFFSLFFVVLFLVKHRTRYKIKYLPVKNYLFFKKPHQHKKNIGIKEYSGAKQRDKTVELRHKQILELVPGDRLKYNLRSSRPLLNVPFVINKYGELNFQYIGSTFINKIFYSLE
jgi:hypothetical protein